MPTAQPRDAGALFRGHAAELGRFLVQRGVPAQDVDDLVQDVFLVAHRSGGYHPGAARPFTWLAAIAVRVASSEARRRRRRAIGGGAPMSPAPSARTPAADVEVWEALARLDAALLRLPARDRDLLVRCAVEDLPRGPLAAGLGIARATVSVRLHAARRRLARALADGAGVSPAGAPAGGPRGPRSSPDRASPG